jgi:hypothetical protein
LDIGSRGSRRRATCFHPSGVFEEHNPLAEPTEVLEIAFSVLDSRTPDEILGQDENGLEAEGKRVEGESPWV